MFAIVCLVWLKANSFFVFSSACCLLEILRILKLRKNWKQTVATDFWITNMIISKSILIYIKSTKLELLKQCCALKLFYLIEFRMKIE